MPQYDLVISEEASLQSIADAATIPVNHCLAKHRQESIPSITFRILVQGGPVSVRAQNEVYEYCCTILHGSTSTCGGTSPGESTVPIYLSKQAVPFPSSHLWPLPHCVQSTGHLNDKRRRIIPSVF